MPALAERHLGRALKAQCAGGEGEVRRSVSPRCAAGGAAGAADRTAAESTAALSLTTSAQRDISGLPTEVSLRQGLHVPNTGNKDKEL